MYSQEENMCLSEKKKGDLITSDDISKMKYTKKVYIKSKFACQGFNKNKKILIRNTE